MKDTALMDQILSNDFDVEVIAESHGSMLFAALRKGGTEHIKTPQGLWETHVSGFGIL